MSSSNDHVILVPACLLCPTYMAVKDSAKLSWRKVIIDFLIENNYSILSLPCPESTFDHAGAGMHRLPHNIKYYEKLIGFSEHCSSLAKQVVEQIEKLTCYGCKVDIILGLENSPTCAVEKMFIWGEGTVKKPGIFIEKLAAVLYEKGISIPIIGINRQSIQKTICYIADNMADKGSEDCGRDQTKNNKYKQRSI